MSRISGDVATPDGTVAANVVICAFPANEGEWAGARPNQIQRVTVENGRFVIVGLPPGDYKLAVGPASTFEGWPSAPALRRLGPAGLPFTLGPGDSPSFRLVVSEGSEPRLISASRSELVRVPGPGASGAVAPPGAPRPPGMPPGRASGPAAPGAIAGRITDADGKPLEGVAVQAARRQTGPVATTPLLPYGQPAVTDADGRYRIAGLPSGNILVVALGFRMDAGAPALEPTRVFPAVPQPDGRKLGPVTTFHPGVTSASAARPVPVATSEVTGIDFVMQRAPLVDVTGRLTGPSSNARTIGAMVHLVPEIVADHVGGRNVQRARVNADGAFTIAGVSPGPYLLTFAGASGWVRRALVVEPPTDGSAPPPLAFETRPFLSVSGRIDIKADRIPAGPEAFKQITASLNPVPLVSGSPLLRVPVSESGEFTVSRVPGGRYVLTVAPPTPWIVLSSMVDGRDTLDFPLEVNADVTGAVISVTDRETNLRGTVKSDDGSPVRAATVVVFSDDRAHWTPGTNRRVRVINAGPGGSYTLTGLPPGAYRAMAVAAGTPVNNGLLTALQARATRFELGIGEARIVDPPLLRSGRGAGFSGALGQWGTEAMLTMEQRGNEVPRAPSRKPRAHEPQPRAPSP